MKETLITKKCKSRELKGDEIICSYRGIPCKDINKEDCVLMEEYKIKESDKESYAN